VPPLLPTVVLGGDVMAVSVARTLAAMGVAVHAVGDPEDPVRHSRACAAFTEIPRTVGTGERYLEWLDERGPRGAVILPGDDESLEIVARHRAELLDWGYSPVEADDEVLLAMLDKERTYELARAAGIPTPRTAAVRTRADAEAAAAAFEFPCGLKPVQSHLFAQVMGVQAKLYVAGHAEELLALHARTQGMGVDFIVTDLIPGGDERSCSCYAYLLPDGTPLYRLTKRNLRQFPVHFGLTTFHEVVWEPAVADLGIRFLQGVGLRGIGCVEFKQDPRDGVWKLIECNHRFTLAQEVVRLAGVDVARIAYCRAAGLPVEPVRGYRTGVRLWQPLEDLSALRGYRAAGELTVAAWARSLLRRWHFPMWTLSDPLPTLRTILGVRLPSIVRGRLRRLARKVPRHAA